MVAYTQHCVSAQVLLPQNNSARHEPVDLCSLKSPLDYSHQDDTTQQHPSQQDEVISSRMVLVLDPEQQRKLDNPSQKQEVVEDSKPAGKDCVLVTVEEQAPTTSTVLLKGRLSPSSTARIRLAVVVGTSQSHLYSIEVSLENERLQRAQVYSEPAQLDEHPLSEVLPLDQTRSRSRVPFCPTGGVTSLTASGSQVWIAYGNGEMVRMHHAGLFPSIWLQGAAQRRTLDDVIGSSAPL